MWSHWTTLTVEFPSDHSLQWSAISLGYFGRIRLLKSCMDTLTRRWIACPLDPSAGGQPSLTPPARRSFDATRASTNDARAVPDSKTALDADVWKSYPTTRNKIIQSMVQNHPVVDENVPYDLIRSHRSPVGRRWLSTYPMLVPTDDRPSKGPRGPRVLTVESWSDRACVPGSVLVC